MNPPAPVVPLTNHMFNELGKVPDLLKDIQPFEGRAQELILWLTDIEDTFRRYREKGATPDQISLIEKTVRRKIRGEAADILNANNIAYDWASIKETLLLYYRDKRDIKTLDFELTNVKKNQTESLSSYYSRVNELLSSIIVQIQTDVKLSTNAHSHIDYFREKALDSFIRGLEKPLNVLLKTATPTSLAKAYQFCIEYYNMDARSAPFRNEFSNYQTPKPRELDLPRISPAISLRKQNYPPPPPPRKFPHTFMTQPNLNPFLPIQRNNTNPFLQPQPRFQPNYNPFSQPQNKFQQNPNPFNYPPKPLPKPEPMEVDQSIRSRMLNYGNRPAFPVKRQHPPSFQAQSFKRQAHPMEETQHFNNIDTSDEPEFEQYPEYQFDDHETYQDYYTPDNDNGYTENIETQATQETNFLGWNPSW